MIRINDDKSTQFVKYDDGKLTKWCNNDNGKVTYFDYNNVYDFVNDALLMITDDSHSSYSLDGGKAKVIKSKEELIDLAFNLYNQLND